MDSHAYIPRPTWVRLLHRGLHVVWYGLMAIAGFAAWQGLGFPAHEAGAAIMVASAVAMAGAATGYYHGELVALPVMSAGLAVCVVWLTQPEQNAVLTGWLVAGFIAPLLIRLLVLNRLAIRQRRAPKGGLVP
jgi:hypothetical protein